MSRYWQASDGRAYHGRAKHQDVAKTRRPHFSCIQEEWTYGYPTADMTPTDQQATKRSWESSKYSHPTKRQRLHEQQKPVRNLSENNTEPRSYDNAVLFNEAECPDPLVQGFIKILILGHSFVSRLRDEIHQEAKAQHICLQETMELRGQRLIPTLVGKGSLYIKGLKKLDNQGKKSCPHVIVLEIGQNDLCWSKYSPLQYAQRLKTELERLFSVYIHCEMIALCGVTHKTPKIFESNHWLYTDKKLEDLNKDIDEFNLHMYRLTRDDRRIIRWQHKGMLFPPDDFTDDGTHPSTPSGIWKHRRSVTQLCRWARKALVDRRTLTKSGLKKKIRRDKLRRRLAKSKAWQAAGGKIVGVKWVPDRPLNLPQRNHKVL